MKRATKEHAVLLDALLQAAPDYVAHVDLDGTIRWINKVLPQLSHSEVVGRPWLSFSPPEVTDELHEVFNTVVATGKTASHECPGIGPWGQPVWYSRRFGPIHRDDEIVGVVIVTRDVTEAKHAEAQLLVSDRMASVGTLAAGVAHEINNPLASVIVNLDFAAQALESLATRVEVPRELVAEIGDAREAADRVRLIVRDLKVFARVEDERRTVVDVEHVLDSTLRMAWNELQHRARLVKEYSGVPRVFANESRLGQVFLNLLVNAVQSIPEGHADRNVIRVSTTRGDDGSIIVTIADTGQGIAPEVQARLFTPFFTTKPVGVGTGLGLSICQRIVASLGGTMQFDSVVGEGSEFRVVLPPAPQQGRVVPRGSPTELPAARRGRVLVVDDEPMIGRLASKILGREHHVSVVESVADALSILSIMDERERFDVILCDLMMPQRTGMDLHAELEQSDPVHASRMVFITGGAFTARARAFLDAVPNPHVEKPFTATGLRTLVNGMIR